MPLRPGLKTRLVLRTNQQSMKRYFVSFTDFCSINLIAAAILFVAAVFYYGGMLTKR